MDALPAGSYLLALHCPACGLLSSVLLTVEPRLTMTNDAAEVRAKVTQRPGPHTCGQGELHAAEAAEDAGGYGQAELDWAQRAAGERRDD